MTALHVNSIGLMHSLVIDNYDGIMTGKLFTATFTGYLLQGVSKATDWTEC